jgi:hypothetical protein
LPKLGASQTNFVKKQIEKIPDRVVASPRVTSLQFSELPLSPRAIQEKNMSYRNNNYNSNLYD